MRCVHPRSESVGRAIGRINLKKKAVQSALRIKLSADAA